MEPEIEASESVVMNVTEGSTAHAIQPRQKRKRSKQRRANQAECGQGPGVIGVVPPSEENNGPLPNDSRSAWDEDSPNAKKKRRRRPARFQRRKKYKGTRQASSDNTSHRLSADDNGQNDEGTVAGPTASNGTDPPAPARGERDRPRGRARNRKGKGPGSSGSLHRPQAPRNTTQFLIDDKRRPIPVAEEELEDELNLDNAFGSMEGIVRRPRVATLAKLAVNGGAETPLAEELSRSDSSDLTGERAEDERATARLNAVIASLTSRLEERDLRIKQLEERNEKLLAEMAALRSFLGSSLRQSGGSSFVASTPFSTVVTLTPKTSLGSDGPVVSSEACADVEAPTDQGLHGAQVGSEAPSHPEPGGADPISSRHAESAPINSVTQPQIFESTISS